VIPSPLQELLDGLALFPERQDRIEMLISLSDDFRNPGPEQVPRDSQHRVPACESEVYVHAVPAKVGLKFLIAVDNPQGISAMAFAEILDKGLSGAPLDQVLQVPDDVVYEVFGRELSMGKTMGLTETLRAVKTLARRAKGE